MTRIRGAAPVRRRGGSAVDPPHFPDQWSSRDPGQARSSLRARLRGSRWLRHILLLIGRVCGSWLTVPGALARSTIFAERSVASPGCTCQLALICGSPGHITLNFFLAAVQQCRRETTAPKSLSRQTALYMRSFLAEVVRRYLPLCRSSRSILHREAHCAATSTVAQALGHMARFSIQAPSVRSLVQEVHWRRLLEPVD